MIETERFVSFRRRLAHKRNDTCRLDGEVHTISTRSKPESNEPATRTRLNARTDKAILDATRELLAEVGVRGLTVDGVAARSGVGKASIYRRYSGKEELALAILLDWIEQVRAPG